jgi:hypothetical protein
MSAWMKERGFKLECLEVNDEDLPKSSVDISVVGGQPVANIPHVQGALYRRRGLHGGP